MCIRDRENGIAVIPYSTLAQGLLTGKYKKGAAFTDGRSRAALFQPENYSRALEVTEVLSEVSAKYGKTPAQGAIAWLLQTPGDVYKRQVRFRKGLRQWIAVLPFITVGLVLFVTFVLYPQIKNIYIAFTDYSIMPGSETPFVGCLLYTSRCV